MTDRQLWIDRVNKHKWLSIPLTLRHFYWPAQPGIHEPIINYLDAWSRWRFEPPFEPGKPRPRPYLFLFGPKNLGKSQVVARGIARFFVINLEFPTVQFVHWAEYVRDQLNGKELKINWSASLLVVDDFDGARPIPQSLSTWLLEDLRAKVKTRAEEKALPTVFISNRNPKKMAPYLSTSPLGKSNPDTIEAADLLLSAMSRHAFACIEFKPLSRPYQQQDLCQLGLHENDMPALGFPREIAGQEVIY